MNKPTYEELEKQLAEKSAALGLAVEALRYCAIEPGSLHPTNNKQNCVAQNALSHDSIQKELKIREAMEDMIAYFYLMDSLGKLTEGGKKILKYLEEVRG